jgi:hypothetical protein
MKKFVFEGPDAVRDCTLEMDIADLRRKVKMYEGGGAFHFLYGDGAPEFCETNLGFIDSCEYTRELERIHSEHGKIDLETLPDLPFCSLDPGEFASMAVLKRLYASSQRRKANVPPIPVEAS